MTAKLIDCYATKDPLLAAAVDGDKRQHCRLRRTGHK